MAKYKLILGTSPSLPADKRKDTTEKVGALITDAGGKIGEVKHRGLTKLAYPIAKATEMDLAVISFESPESAVGALRKELGKLDGVMRAMVIREEGVKG